MLGICWVDVCNVGSIFIEFISCVCVLLQNEFNRLPVSELPMFYYWKKLWYLQGSPDWRWTEQIPANTRCRPNVGLLFARRWPNSKPTLGRRLMFAKIDINGTDSILDSEFFRKNEAFVKLELLHPSPVKVRVTRQLIVLAHATVWEIWPIRRYTLTNARAMLTDWA